MLNLWLVGISYIGSRGGPGGDGSDPVQSGPVQLGQQISIGGRGILEGEELI